MAIMDKGHCPSNNLSFGGKGLLLFTNSSLTWIVRESTGKQETHNCEISPDLPLSAPLPSLLRHSSSSPPDAPTPAGRLPEAVPAGRDCWSPLPIAGSLATTSDGAVTESLLGHAAASLCTS